ncbi:transglutaminase domain-containing protein, partial [Candidatus Babeliales bacterium]|nr:transglutaminase domain-containing protein [Candidatus Babeliales bacterium]
MLDFTPRPIQWAAHRTWLRWIATLIFIPVLLYCTEFALFAQTIQQMTEVEKARLLQIDILEINNDLDALEKSIKEGTFTTEAEDILAKLPDYRDAAELHFELLRDDLEAKGFTGDILDAHDLFLDALIDRIDFLEAQAKALLAVTGSSERETIAANLEQLDTDSPTPLDPDNLYHRDTGDIDASSPETTEAFPLRNVAEDGSFVDILAQSTLVPVSGPPVDEDTQATPDIQITPIIQAKADELGNKAVAIYEYVRNEFNYEPYYGSIKGAHQTFLEGAGNDMDLASVLMALLRASNIPCRYVYGAVEVSIERAADWVGVEDPNAVASVFARNNIPVVLVKEGGKVSSIKIDHTWVMAHVKYGPFLGSTQEKGDAWVPLDPSFKIHDFTLNAQAAEAVEVDPAVFLKDIKYTGLIDADKSSCTALNHPHITEQLLSWAAEMQEFAVKNTLTQVTLFRTPLTQREDFGLLPASTPYTPLGKIGSLYQLPESVRYGVKIKLSNKDGKTVFEKEIRLSSLAGKRLTLAYSPATDEDKNVLLKNKDSLSFPVYIVNLLPELRLDDTVLVSGSEIGMGKMQSMEITFTPPFREQEIVNANIKAGEYTAFVFDFQKVSRQAMEARRVILENTLQGLNDSISESAMHAVYGDQLQLMGMNYFYQVDKLNDVTSSSHEVVYTREPSLLLATAALEMEYLLGAPYKAGSGVFSLNVVHDIYTPVSVTGKTFDEKQFMLISSLTGSSLE